MDFDAIFQESALTVIPVSATIYGDNLHICSIGDKVKSRWDEIGSLLVHHILGTCKAIDFYVGHEVRVIEPYFGFVPPRRFPKGKLGVFQVQREAWRGYDEAIVQQSRAGLEQFILTHDIARVDLIVPSPLGVIRYDLPARVKVWEV